MWSNNLIRTTESVCPECLNRIKADIIEENKEIYLIKECLIHGVFKTLVSTGPWYYRKLNDFYFSLFTESFPQRDYIIHLTNRCNLNCSICLANANIRENIDYPLEKIRNLVKDKRGFKFDLMGAEPTMREDLPEIMKIINKSGNISALHTNGIKIADYNYLKKLKNAGLDEVHLQFDGFDDEFYQKIRGRKLLDIKLNAIENLSRLNISTDLKVTVVKGFNENQMIKVLEFAVQKRFVKEVFFLGCRFLGKARKLPYQNCLMPDELVDILEKQSAGIISRGDIFNFQKLYFALLFLNSSKKCFYNQHFLVIRDKNGYLPINKIINLDRIQRKLDRLKGFKKRKKKAVFYLFLGILTSLVSIRGILFVKDFLVLQLLIRFGFKLNKIPSKMLLLGFISACDVYTYDYQIALNCGKGAVSSDLGIQEIGAWDNIIRDRVMK